MYLTELVTQIIIRVKKKLYTDPFTIASLLVDGFHAELIYSTYAVF